LRASAAGGCCRGPWPGRRYICAAFSSSGMPFKVSRAQR
jgi:hypothetical protein